MASMTSCDDAAVCLPMKGFLPMDSSRALALYKDKLSDYERKEILMYEQIYYVGHNAVYKVPATQDEEDFNYGFDNSLGLYHLMEGDHIAYRYEIVSFLGRGTCGQVIEAFDHKEKKTVAIKVIRNKERYHFQGLKESLILEMLRNMGRQDLMNMPKMLDNFEFRNHLFIILELLSINLRKLIQKTEYEGISLSLVGQFCCQLLQFLVPLHQMGIIHSDLKPDNILLEKEGSNKIKIIDFGLYCVTTDIINRDDGTRYYRAPEIALGVANKKCPIDMWALGCTLAELFVGRPLFAGESEFDQLACIMEVLGMPPEKLLSNLEECNKFFINRTIPKYCSWEKIENTVVLRGGYNKQGIYRDVPGSQDLKKVLKNCQDDSFVDFIKECLQWDPDVRMTAEKTIDHPWIQACVIRL